MFSLIFKDWCKIDESPLQKWQASEIIERKLQAWGYKEQTTKL